MLDLPSCEFVLGPLSFVVSHTYLQTSTTYNTFMYLTLPIPNHRGTNRVTLQQCLDAFVKEEVMEKSDAWYGPAR